MVAGSARTRSTRAAPAVSGVHSSPICFRYASTTVSTRGWRTLSRRQIYEEFFDLYKSIYSHVQDDFKSLQSLLRRTSS